MESVRVAALLAARLALGPLTLAGFFLPWTSGRGPLVGTDFSGFALVRFSGDLQQLELTTFESAALWGARLLMLGVVVAATWNTLLAPTQRQHALYTASAWYLALLAMVATGLTWIAAAGPLFGAQLWLAGATLFLISWAWDRLDAARRDQSAATGRRAA